MSRNAGVPGPGSVRVGRFIGRLGVVSLPAVEVGLALDERVVRRHVAKLERAGWLERAAGVWGEGSVAWLTTAGLTGTALGGLPPVKAPPAPGTVDHGVAVAWTAARVERRGRRWFAARELALEPDRWAVPMRDARGMTQNRLPDLAVWLPGAERPVAVIVENGHRREDRQRAILEGWRDAVWSGRYASIRYDCASDAATQRIGRIAKRASLNGSRFTAATQLAGPEIIDLAAADASPVASASPGAPLPTLVPSRADEDIDDAARPAPPPPALELRSPAPIPPPETPEAAAEREKRYREMLGIPEQRPRRRWRR